MKTQFILFSVISLSLLLNGCVSSSTSDSSTTVEDLYKQLPAIETQAQKLYAAIPGFMAQGKIPHTDFAFQKKPGHWCSIHNLVPKDGVVTIMLFEKGVLRSVSHQKQGKNDGRTFLFYDNARLYMSANYKNGRVDGKTFYFLPDGSLYGTLLFQDHKPIDGILIGYPKTGPDKTIQVVAHVYENGKRIKTERLPEHLEKEIKKHSGLK